MKYLAQFLALLLAFFSTISNAQENPRSATDVLSAEFFSGSQHKIFDRAIANKSLIGLGEATHGTSEFFKLKASTIKYLITQHGFKLIIFESFFANTEKLNEYIFTEKGDPYQAIFKMGYYFYFNQDFLEFIEWIKAYNSVVNNENKVKIYGCDMTAPQVTASKVKALLSEKKQLTPSLTENLDWLIEQPAKRQYQKEEVKIMKKLSNELTLTFEKLDQGNLISQHYHQILQQCIKYRLSKNGYGKANMRNKFMAQNALFIQKHLENNNKAITWTHNAHIAKRSGQDKIVPMGKQLFDEIGSAYYSIGVGFNRGSFLAINNDTRRREKITVGEVPKGSSDYHFSKINESIFFLDFDQLLKESKDNNWLLKKTISRHIGEVYYPDEFNRNYRKHVLPESYDAIIFVTETTPVQMLPTEKLK